MKKHMDHEIDHPYPALGLPMAMESPMENAPGLGRLPQRPGPAQPLSTLTAHQHLALRRHSAGLAGRHGEDLGGFPWGIW